MLRTVHVAICLAALASASAHAQTPPRGALFVAAGDYHACAAMADGTVRCWGNDERGQLGDGTTVARSRPVRVRGVRDATQLALGFQHSCALVLDGSVWCWGEGYEDANGVPSAAVRVDGVDATALVAGQSSTWALRRDGHVVSFTRNAVTPLAGVADAVALAAYGYLTCAVIRDGTVRCWAPADPHYPDVPTEVPGLRDVVTLSIGTMHTYARLRDGTILEWESSTFAMRNGGVVDGWVGAGLRTRPTAIRAAVIGRVACALMPNAHVDCWRDPRPPPGDDETWVAIPYGPNRPARMEPGIPRSEQGVGDVMSLLPQLTAHVSQCSYSDIRRTVDCSPAGPYETYRYGLETATRDRPVRLTLRDVDVHAGSWHQCALAANGTVSCWGANTDGQLGSSATCPGPSPSAPWQLDEEQHRSHGAADRCPSPVPVASLANVTHLAAGSSFTCARSADGSVSCWGDNTHGELGDGTTTDRHAPTRVRF